MFTASFGVWHQLDYLNVFRDDKLPYDDATRHLSVVLGTTDLRDNEQSVRIPVRRIFPHPEFDIDIHGIVYGKFYSFRCYFVCFTISSQLG